MAITRTLLVTLLDASSVPIENAIVSAILDQTDYDTTDAEYVVPTQITARTDAAGEATLNLWPNARGDKGSRYRIFAQKADGTVVLDVWADVPDADGTNLDDIAVDVDCGTDSSGLTRLASNTIDQIVVVTAAEYAAIPTKSASTMYVVIG